MLISSELYLNSYYYANHPLIDEKFDVNLHNSSKSIFSICSSEAAMKINPAGDDYDQEKIIKQEAILNCSIGTWGSMLCMMAGAEALGRTIHSHYPVTHGDSRAAHVLNASITPSVPTSSKISSILHILWIVGTKTSRPYHFVPLFVTAGTTYSEQKQRNG